MMELKYIKLKVLLMVMLGLCSMSAFAEFVEPWSDDKQNKFEVRYDITNDGIISLIEFVNLCGNNVTLSIDNGEKKKVLGETNGGQNTLKLDKKVCNDKIVVTNNKDFRKTIFIADRIREKHGIKVPSIKAETKSAPQQDIRKFEENTTSTYKEEFIPVDTVICAFRKYLDNTPYYSKSDYKNLESKVGYYLKVLDTLGGIERKNYIVTINEYIKGTKEDLDKNDEKEEKERLINEFIDNYYSGKNINELGICREKMNDILTEKLKERSDQIEILEKAVNKDSNKSLIYWGIVLILLIVAAIVYYKVREKRNAKAPTVVPVDAAEQAAKSDIVVRRKTTTVLKKQNLDDVVDNPSYLAINCSEFCDDSAVKTIFLKNTCIKEIYNMYADDLKNPDHPNEDGCMVLGRWVHNDKTDAYNVSLEEIVKPGDDAVFAEYELNFGGKIKLKVSERLRKLRRETDLQYDMTCWVHSHPGLGVFFSNADSSVQMQLKHPSHPKFLTALVIDILTSEQETGIFTFKHDMSINSKPELKKMYSLEELYKWAVASERNSFKTEDYFNIMNNSENRLESCRDIFLSNGAIIDMCQMAMEQKSGFAGWVQGFRKETKGGNRFIINSVTSEEKIPDNEAVGCFLIGTYRSIPTIRKEIANAENIQFVMSYSISDGMLTAIPMTDRQLVEDEKSYAEEKLDELKIWTRRKR